MNPLGLVAAGQTDLANRLEDWRDCDGKSLRLKRIERRLIALWRQERSFSLAMR
jgi:hypothetical protein